MATTEQKLRVIIDAENKTSAALNDVGKGLDKMKGKIESWQPAFQKMAVVGTAAFAGVAYAIKGTIDEANEAQKVQAQLGAVLKSTGNAAGLFIEDLNDQAAALQKMTTYDDEAIGSMQALLLTFTNIKGAVFQEALPAILDISTAMGQDLQSSAVQVGKALNDPINGISALTRIGVTFSEQQKEMITTMVETGNVAGAQGIIIAELGKEFGGSAAAAAQTFGGQMQQLNNRFSDMKESIGTALIPIITQFATTIQPIVEKIAAWIEQNPELAGKILLVVAALTGLVAVLGILGTILPVIMTGFALLTGPIGLITIAVVALGIVIFKNWDAIKAKTIAVFTAVRDFLVGIWNDVKASFTAVYDWIMDKINAVLRAYEKVKSAVSSVVGKVTGKKAAGGPVMANHPYMVGENGPELFTPSSAGTITPNGRLGSGGGVVINVTGNSFMGREGIAETIANDLVKALSYRMKLSH